MEEKTMSYFPDFAQDRRAELARERGGCWFYAGWIANPPSKGCGQFEDLVARFRESAWPKYPLKEVDLYPTGAILWVDP